METGNEDVDAFIRMVAPYLAEEIKVETQDANGGFRQVWPLDEFISTQRVHALLKLQPSWGAHPFTALEFSFINEDTRLLFEEKFKDKIKFSRPSKYTPDRRIWTRIELSNLV